MATFEDLLQTCHRFLVDDTNGRELGVVDYVEYDDSGRVETLLVTYGWRRRSGRVPRDEIVYAEPKLRRLIVLPQKQQ